MKENSDYLFLGTIGILIINTIVQVYLYNYSLSVNNYLGFAAWSISLTLRFGALKYKRLATGWLLILGTLNVISFTLGRITLSVGNISETGAEAIGLNPLIGILLIAYYFVNKTSIKRILYTTFQGTKEEQETKNKQEVKYYLEKFSKCSDQEFENILEDFTDYPLEAQIAINHLKAEKESCLGQ